MATRKYKGNVHYMVRTPTNEIHYDVPDLKKAIQLGKDILDKHGAGSEVKIYSLCRVIRVPRTMVEIDEFREDDGQRDPEGGDDLPDLGPEPSKPWYKSLS